MVELVESSQTLTCPRIVHLGEIWSHKHPDVLWNSTSPMALNFIKVTLIKLLPTIMVQWKMGASPRWDSFQLGQFSAEPWLWESAIFIERLKTQKKGKSKQNPGHLVFRVFVYPALWGLLQANISTLSTNPGYLLYMRDDTAQSHREIIINHVQASSYSMSVYQYITIYHLYQG